MLLNHPQWRFAQFWPERTETRYEKAIEPTSSADDTVRAKDVMRQLVSSYYMWYTSVEFGLEARDRLVLYTDGVFEAASPSDEVFGYERFKKCILNHRHGSCDDFTGSLLAELEKWTTVGRRPMQSDDVTVIAIEFS